jgi:hypothetical protein
MVTIAWTATGAIRRLKNIQILNVDWLRRALDFIKSVPKHENREPTMLYLFFSALLLQSALALSGRADEALEW